MGEHIVVHWYRNFIFSLIYYVHMHTLNVLAHVWSQRTKCFIEYFILCCELFISLSAPLNHKLLYLKDHYY